MPLNIAEVAAQLGIEASPKLQLIAQLLSQRDQEDDEDTEEEERAKEHARKLEKRALTFLRSMNSELAAACGACVCWGRRPACSLCLGQGAAGFSAPDPVLFRRHIEPVLYAMGLVQDARLARTNDPNAAPAAE